MDLTRSDASLSSYVQAKEGVAQLLRETRRLLDSRRAGGGEQLRELLSRLAEDQFHLVVLGQFKRGKSSLINAVIGRSLLPVAAVPLTSVVTALRYGPAERVLLRRRGFVLPQEIPLDELADYVTERGNPRNEKQVLGAEIEVPEPFLRRGLRFIDTPGIGSPHEHNTVTTHAFLPEADAAIFVTSAESPLTDTELQFLDTIRQHVRKIIFVVNKIDQLDPDDHDEVLSFMRRELAHRLGVADVPLFPISAREALAAKQEQNDRRLQASGLPAFEAALSEFLSVERGAVFLTALLDRALRLLDAVRFSIDLGQSAHLWPESEVRRRAADFDRRFAALERTRASLIGELRTRLESWQQDVLQPEMARLETETLTALSTSLAEQAHRLQDLPPDDYYLQLRDWVRSFLDQRGRTWLENWGAQFDAMAEQSVAALRPQLVQLVTATSREAASVFELTKPDDDGSAAESIEAALPAPTFNLDHAWRRLGFRLQPEYDMPPLLPLPKGLAQRAALRSLRRQAEPEVAHLIKSLEQTVHDYLTGAISSLDIQSSRIMEEPRERVLAEVLPASRAESGRRGADLADEPTDQRATLDDLTTRISRLRDALATGSLAADAIEDNLAPAESHATPEPRPDLPEVEALDGPANLDGIDTCPVCAAVYDAVHGYLCQLQYQIATDKRAQQALRDGGGLCATHTWQLEAVSSPQGLSRGYAPLLQHTARQVERAAGLPTPAARQQLERLLPTWVRCPVCLVRDRAQSAALSRLVDALSHTGVPETLNRTGGLCLAHLYLLLEGVDDDLASEVLRQQARRLSDVAETMQQFLLKVDARRRDLLMDGDDQAYLTGLMLVAGDKYAT